MRLLVKVEATKNQAYDAKYHHKVQGLIYDLVNNYDPSLHDRPGYKYFCFSNIFPIADMNSGDIRNLIISSADPKLIESLRQHIPEHVNIGDMSYTLLEKKTFTPEIRTPLKLVTATPVTMRIPKERYSDYGITSDKDWLYWRPEYSFTAYVKQLEENLIKKYNEYHKTEAEETAIFQQYIYKKPTHNPTIIDNREEVITGSIWEYDYTHITPEQKKMIAFALDTGIGERNTMGYGFLNAVKGLE